MTLDEAIRHVRIIADNCKGIDSAALTLLIDHAEAGQTLRDAYPAGMRKPNADTIRRLAETLNESRSFVAERLRDFDWGEGVPAVPMVPTLRDQFAMRIVAGLCANPGGPFQANATVGWELTNCTDADVASLTWRLADAMLAARGTK